MLSIHSSRHDTTCITGSLRRKEIIPWQSGCIDSEFLGMRTGLLVRLSVATTIASFVM